MQYISMGQKLANAARAETKKRLFLFASNKPESDMLVQAWNSLAMTACSYAYKIDGTSLKCSRMKGWANNKFYRTLIGPINYTKWLQSSTGNDYFGSGSFISNAEGTFTFLFSQAYVTGTTTQINDTATQPFSGNLAEYSDGPKTFLSSVMLLPALDAKANTNIVSTTSVSAGQSASSTWSQGAYRYNQSITSYYNQFTLNVLTNLRSNSASQAQSFTANANVSIGSAAENSVTIIIPSTTTITTWDNFGGSNGSSTVKSRGLYSDPSTQQYTDRFFSVGSNVPDDAAYKIKWAALPVYLPAGRSYAEILEEGVDFVHDAPSLPNTIPNLTLIATESVQNPIAIPV